MYLDPPVLEISDVWSYQDINHVLTEHDTSHHMYRVIPMITSPTTTTTPAAAKDADTARHTDTATATATATDVSINNYSNNNFHSKETIRGVVMSRIRTYAPLLR